MNAAALPAPLHLRFLSGQTLSGAQAHQVIASFLSSDAPSVLSGAGGAAAARESLARLAEGLKEEAAEGQVEGVREEGGKKRRKSEKGEAGETSKRRKFAGGK